MKILQFLVVSFSFLFSSLFSSEIVPSIPFRALDELPQLNTTNSEVQRIYLVRHGESEWNLSHTQGVEITLGKSKNVKLTQRGKNQAIQLAKKLVTKITPEHKLVVLSSSALRAQDTAHLLFEKLRESHSQVELGDCYEGLCELGMGIWEGKYKDLDFQEAIEPWLRATQAQKYTISKVGDGESFKQVAQRALKELESIVKEYPQSTLFVVSHAHTMNAIMLEVSTLASQLSQESDDDLPLVVFKNCDLLEIALPQPHAIDQAQIIMHINSEI